MYRSGPECFLAVCIGLATLAGAAGLAGCHSNAIPAATVPDNSGPDPADANMAPLESNQPQPQAAAPVPSRVLRTRSENTPRPSAEQYPPQSAPPPPDQPYGNGQNYPNDQSYGNDQNYAYNAPDYEGEDQVDAGQQALEEADQPPPPLPDYEQPEAPAPNYLWTPGYWGWSSGFYWVPGVWCAPPFYGALWTPPYWGFYGNRYLLHRGYWGPHIGFYGGINYGFGYTGSGYHGGYWNGRNFYYNRAVNRINVNRITNVYNRTVIVNNNTRVSYNGGRGGVPFRPQPSEVAAMRGPRTPPMSTQLQVRQEAAQNRAQFYSQNRGRPAIVAAARPIPADRNVQRPNFQNGSAQNRPGRPSALNPGNGNPGVGSPEDINHPGRPDNRPQVQPIRPSQPQIPNQPQIRAAQPQNRPQIQPTRPTQPQVQPARPNPPQTRPAQPQPQPRPAIQPRPQPAQQPQVRPQPRPQPQPQFRPTPQPPPRPAPQPQFRPQPQTQPRPAQPQNEGRPR